MATDRHEAVDRTASAGTPGAQSAEARLRRGVRRLLAEMGYGTLSEFRLTTGRRVDVIGLNGEAEFVIVEIKTTLVDFRGDRKWREYLPFCDRFYFAVPDSFPDSVLPGECGVIVADGYGGAVCREPCVIPVNPTRKRRQLVRFALAASTRLQRAYDPGI